MEIRTLRYFLAVAREENMTRAAEQLHVTQPTLSKTLKALEDELGKKLFTRHSFSIRLTEEGVLLRNRAEDLVSMADRIAQEFVTLDDITGGDIYFGLAESHLIQYLAREIWPKSRTPPNTKRWRFRRPMCGAWCSRRRIRFRKKRPSRWMISLVCHCSVQSKAGKMICRPGAATGCRSCGWRAPFGCHITVPCLRKRALGIC